MSKCKRPTPQRGEWCPECFSPIPMSPVARAERAVATEVMRLLRQGGLGEGWILTRKAEHLQAARAKAKGKKR